MKKTTLTLLTTAALILNGCNSDSHDDNTEMSTSQLRVTHASADAPLVSILMDGDVVSGLSNVDYQQGSPLLTVDSGSHDLIVRGLLANDATADVITANAVNLAPDMQYDVFAVNNVSAIEPVILSRSNEAPDDQSIRVDVLHGHPNVGGVDIHVTTDPSISADTIAVSDLTFKEDDANLPVTLPAGDYRIRITLAGKSTDADVVYDSGNIALDGGSDLMVTAVPNVSGGAVSPVNLLVADGTSVNVLRNTGEKSTVRVGHAVADLDDVDVRASGNVVFGLDSISYETIKSLDLTPDSYDLTVTPSGATTPEAIKAPGTTFAAGSETTIFAVGQFAAQSIEPVVIEDDLRSIASYAKLRVVHANPVAGTVDIHATPTGTGFSADTAVLKNVNFKDSAVLNVGEGNYDFAVAAAGTTNVLLTATDVALAGGNVATAFATENSIALNVDK
ncbi:DUF4397 domain-containing protein [Photobacterium angustum]|uniref:DUF4397 domain-containing protein n=1 Tax=Photobacterium angustum TaxID=661 RepID=UPI0005DB708F|nr:DUF4397 domain-containing protein [Photobacterium angustum]KJG16620.1 hypothetical protein UA33_13865 [Photobacterium angustum]KJG29730.1 hypothetical protein UA36_14675 [Photobacterium angustum]PSW93903.1 DUF4397 domain-containing protein [Photobacterium angustum]PSX00483.1 DUF4397 domain-containing protein [Photobacterium angustum]PSX33451.1 DUF4397 domain-containing protein [Photobacterium angustum]